LLLFAQADGSIPMPFLAVLILCLTIIFVRFGLLSRPNPTVIAALFIFCAVGVWCDFPDPGAEPAIRGTTADFQHTAAQRPRAA
jgi:hypothetical protein